MRILLEKELPGEVVVPEEKAKYLYSFVRISPSDERKDLQGRPTKLSVDRVSSLTPMMLISAPLRLVTLTARFRVISLLMRMSSPERSVGKAILVVAPGEIETVLGKPARVMLGVSMRTWAPLGSFVEM